MARRHVLRVENIREVPPQRCMFFGAAAIYDAIEFCCSRVYALGFKGNLGMGLTLGGHAPERSVRRWQRTESAGTTSPSRLTMSR